MILFYVLFWRFDAINVVFLVEVEFAYESVIINLLCNFVLPCNRNKNKSFDCDKNGV
jgi:hypothetical protein